MKPTGQTCKQKQVYAKAEHPREHGAGKYHDDQQGHDAKWQPVQVAPRGSVMAYYSIPEIYVGCKRKQADGNQGCQYHVDVVSMESPVSPSFRAAKGANWEARDCIYKQIIISGETITLTVTWKGQC